MASQSSLRWSNVSLLRIRNRGLLEPNSADSWSLLGVFDFTYGAVEELLEPILAFYPSDPKLGSPFFTGPETFGLSSNYKRLSSFIGDILFQAPRRHFLRETPKDFGEDSWNYLYREPRAGAQARFGSTWSRLLALLRAATFTDQLHPQSSTELISRPGLDILTSQTMR